MNLLGGSLAGHWGGRLALIIPRQDPPEREHALLPWCQLGSSEGPGVDRGNVFDLLPARVAAELLINAGERLQKVFFRHGSARLLFACWLSWANATNTPAAGGEARTGGLWMGRVAPHP